MAFIVIERVCVDQADGHESIQLQALQILTDPSKAAPKLSGYKLDGKKVRSGVSIPTNLLSKDVDTVAMDEWDELEVEEQPIRRTKKAHDGGRNSNSFLFSDDEDDSASGTGEVGAADDGASSDDDLEIEAPITIDMD